MVQLFKTEQDLRYVQEQTGYNSLRTVALYVDDQKKAIDRNDAGFKNQTNIKKKPKESEPSKTCEACGTIDVAELEIANVLKRVVAIVRYPRSEM